MGDRVLLDNTLFPLVRPMSDLHRFFQKSVPVKIKPRVTLHVKGTNTMYHYKKKKEF